MRTFRPSQYFLPHSTDREQCLLTSPLSPSTDSSLMGYATSASAVTISSTTTNRETDNRDMSWTQDFDPYFLNTPQSTAGLDPPDQSVMSLQTLHWDQPPTDQEIRDLLDIPDDAPPSHYQESSTSQPSMFTLSEASRIGPSASQAAPPSYHTGTTAQRDNEIKRLRQTIRHVSLYSLWAMECYQQLEGRRGQTATRLQADDAYRSLLRSTMLWPGANTPGADDMTP